ncbi:hypothetical protein ACS0TY_034469 [Phlomoides rotata]
MTNAYKKFEGVEKFFQECVDAAMGSVPKMQYIKEQCIAMKNEILNWNPILESDNVAELASRGRGRCGGGRRGRGARATS